MQPSMRHSWSRPSSHQWIPGIPALLLGLCGCLLGLQPQTSQAQTTTTARAAIELQQVDSAALETARGGMDTTSNTVLNEIHANGTISNNQAYNLTTGGNSIAGGAFSGANGLSTVVQNSGNNVLIQNSTIINIQFQQ